jgi:hypothetical protein
MSKETNIPVGCLAYGRVGSPQVQLQTDGLCEQPGEAPTLHCYGMTHHEHLKSGNTIL